MAGHPYHATLAALVIGLALSPAGLTAAAGAAALVAALGAALRVPMVGLSMAAMLLAGVGMGGARLDALDSGTDVLGGGRQIAADAVLLERPRASTFGSTAEVEIASGPLAGVRLAARTPADVEWPAGARPGTQLSVTGSAAPARTRPGADFDYPAYLRRRGVAGELAVRTLAPTGRSRAGIMGWIDGMRARAERAIDRGATEGHAALARGMVLGDDAAIATTVRDDFRSAGLGHLLAVSGQNVMLLGALALPVLAAVGLGPRARLFALLCLICVYVPLAGASPSLQRAGVMGAAGVVALAAGRPASRVYALLFAGAATLALNPRVVGDPGWQLSFAAVIGIFAFAPAIRRPLGALPRTLGEGIGITVAATIVTTPLVAHHFATVSLAALPANVLALPAVAPVMWIGMVQAALGQAVVLGPPLDGAALAAASLLGSVSDVLLGYLEALARRFAELPGAEVTVGVPGPIVVVAAYAAIAAGALAARRLAARAGPALTACAGHWRTAPTWQRHASLVALVAVVVAGSLRLAAPPPSPDRLTVSFLDVGQGDATLVQHPDGAAVLFDGGPAEARVARLVRAAGVRRLSAIVATHASADHHGGLTELLERVPVDLLIDGGDGTTDPTFRAMVAAAQRRGIDRLAAEAGQSLRLGGLLVRVLGPPPRPEGPPPEDPNPRAVAAVVSAGGFDLFLSGDAESPSLLPLALPDVEAMKVSHHGSADPGLPDVLAELRPEVAAIEVGENSYGHPTPSTLAALEAAGADVYRTDRDGTVRVAVEGEKVTVTTAR